MARGQCLIVVSKTNQKPGLASVVRTPDPGEVRRTGEVGVPVCVGGRLGRGLREDPPFYELVGHRILWSATLVTSPRQVADIFVMLRRIQQRSSAKRRGVVQQKGRLFPKHDATMRWLAFHSAVWRTPCDL